MMKPTTKIVSAPELRRLFNNAGYPQRIATGEFSARLLREGRPSGRVKEPAGTKSQILGYFDAANRLIAVVHQYLRPDGTLGASGKPDPKKILHEGILYEAR